MRPVQDDVVQESIDRLTSQFKKYDPVKGYTYSSISSSPYPIVVENAFIPTLSLSGTVEFKETIVSYSIGFDATTVAAIPLSAILRGTGISYVEPAESVTATPSIVSGVIKATVVAYDPTSLEWDSVTATPSIVSGVIKTTVVAYNPTSLEWDSVTATASIVGGSIA